MQKKITRRIIVLGISLILSTIPAFAYYSRPNCFDISTYSYGESIGPDAPNVAISNVSYNEKYDEATFTLYTSKPSGETSTKYALEVYINSRYDTEVNYDVSETKIITMESSDKLYIRAFVDNKNVSDVTGETLKITFDKTKFDQESPTLEVIQDTQGWYNQTDGITIPVTASDNKGVTSITYKVSS